MGSPATEAVCRGGPQRGASIISRKGSTSFKKRCFFSLSTAELSIAAYPYRFCFYHLSISYNNNGGFLPSRMCLQAAMFAADLHAAELAPQASGGRTQFSRKSDRGWPWRGSYHRAEGAIYVRGYQQRRARSMMHTCIILVRVDVF